MLMKKSRGFQAIMFASGVALGCLKANADITGFSGFAPVNGAGGAIGYSGGGSTFEVTDGNNGEAVSGWNPVAQSINGFTVGYSYQTIPQYSYGTYGVSVQADGSTIAFQNPTTGSTTALGGGGGSLGYEGIGTNSAAIGYELFDGYYNYPGGSELLLNGNAAANQNQISNLDLSTGDTTIVRLQYAGNTLTQTIADLSTGGASTQTYNVNLQSTLGSSTALIGVTGGTGGFNSTQTISNFKYAQEAAAYSPIGLTGFTQKMIVPVGGSSPGSITATMDNGTALTGATYYETGLAGSPAGTGLPASGSTFTSQNDGQHVFTMQSYSANDALLLGASTTTGVLSLTSPQAYGGLSILMADGNGTEPFKLVVTFMNGSTETIDGAVSPDWFNNGTVAWVAGGRTYDDGSIEDDGSNPNIYQVDLPLTDQTDPIASLAFTYEGSATSTSNLAIFGVSGIAVPEPSSLALLGFAGLTLVRRRPKR